MAAEVELDHVFLMVPPEGEAEVQALERAGLRSSYRRPHPGQGTANVCYCFDNAYLELLWVTDPREVQSPPIARTRLAPRAAWRETDASPFGIAIRTSDPGAPPPFDWWPYTPPYLPAGAHIAVATASDDPRQPFLFRSPATRRPDQWADGRAGARQTATGLAEIGALQLEVPATVAPAQALVDLARTEVLSLTTGGSVWRLKLRLSGNSLGPNRYLSLPDMVWSSQSDHI